MFNIAQRNHPVQRYIDPHQILFNQCVYNPGVDLISDYQQIS